MTKDSDDFDIPDPIEELSKHPERIKDADRELVDELARRYLFDQDWVPLIDFGELPDPTEDKEESDEAWESIPEEVRDEQITRWVFEEDYGQRHAIAWLKAENEKLRQIIVEDLTTPPSGDH
jgi:hypothetical protein